MMKTTKRVKVLEVAAVDAVRDLLEHVPSLEIASVDYEQYARSKYAIDAQISLRHGGVKFAIIIEVKSKGEPRFVRSAIYTLRNIVAHLERSKYPDTDIGQRLIPMFTSPYLSPESRAICADNSVAYLDFFGNA